jgi:regulator of sigma E protease
MPYLEIVVLLSLLVLLHELGHLGAAKAMGIPIAAFSVGLGPRLWSFRRGGTEYSLRLLPLGGFVLPDAESFEDFQAIPLRRRLAYFLGGPLANLAVALPLFALLNGAPRGASFLSLLFAPFGQVAKLIGQFVTSLPHLFAHPESLSGVVGIVVMGGRAASGGHTLEVAIELTVSLAVLNLLPIPVLDGGQVVMSCLEKVFPRAARLRLPATVLGAVLLAAAMVLFNVRDVVRYWG